MSTYLIPSRSPVARKYPVLPESFACWTVANKLSERTRQFLNQRRRGNDLLFARGLRIFVNIDHFQIVVVRQILFTDFLQVVNSSQRSRGRTSDVESQDVFRSS